MTILKNRIIGFLYIVSVVVLINFAAFGVAESANNTGITIEKNLKPGMALKDAVELIGPPEKITISDAGTILIPYDDLGFSIELMNNGSVIKQIHVDSSASQPVPVKKSKVIKKADNNVVNIKVREEVKKELREELREEVKEELREEVLEQVNKEVTENFDAFELFGFKVQKLLKGVVVTEITPGSAAEKGGLKKGEVIRKVFYEGSVKLNIFTVKGLNTVLRRSIKKRKKIINILQDKNYYYKVEVPKIK